MKEHEELSAQECAIRGVKKMSSKNLFCTSNMMKHELERCGRKVEFLSDDKKATLEQQRRLDAEISSKHVNHN